jgi:predicted glycosyltransferase
MKKIMFYCQYLSGMGHLVRSREIVRSLVKFFQVYFINGGPILEGFEMPAQVELIRLPALWLEDGKFCVADTSKSVEEIKEIRKNQLITVFDQIQPDCLITEFFPFGRHKLLFELLPLIKHIKSIRQNTKIICSLRDVIGKVSEPQEEETICKLMNQYFDLLLFHSDPNFQTFAASFSRYKDIKCQAIHTGFVTEYSEDDYGKIPKTWSEDNPNIAKILVSIGGGRIGYELLKTVVEASAILEQKIKYDIQIFTGPFLAEEKYLQLQAAVVNTKSIRIRRFTSQLLYYMRTADISLSLTGYNTTMNILSTGVRSIVVPLGHDHEDKEQLVRSQKLEQLGIVEVIHPEKLEKTHLANKIVELTKKNLKYKCLNFNLQGADNTAIFLQKYLDSKVMNHAIFS